MFKSKRILALIMVFSVILGSWGTAIFAAENESSTENFKTETAKEEPVKAETASDKQPVLLEGIILSVKAKIDIPVEYTDFNSDIEGYNGKTNYRLSWMSPSNGYDRSGINVTVDESGNIFSYHHYQYNRDMDNHRRLPAISRERALDAAQKFCWNLCTDIAGQLQLDNAASSIIEYDGSYRFVFLRKINGILFEQNSVNITVNGQTGLVSNMYRNWTDNISFPEATGLIGFYKAQKLFKDKLGLVLQYRRSPFDPTRTYLEYAVRSQDIFAGINAKTGDRVDLLSNGGYNPYYDSIYARRPYIMESVTAYREITLTEAEKAELQKLNGLVSVEEAEKYIRDIPELKLNDSYNVNQYSFGRYGASNDIILRMNFVGQGNMEDLPKDFPQEKINIMIAAGEFYKTVAVSLNARTKEIIEINTYGMFDYGSGNEKQPDANAVKTIAENFLSKYKEGKFKQSVLTTSIPGIDYGMRYGTTNPGSLYYIRTANNIPFVDNYLYILVDANGTIRNFREVWDEKVEFAPAANVISLVSAYNTLFYNNPLQLKYSLSGNVYPDEYYLKYGVKNPEGGFEIPGASICYGLDLLKPMTIDAITGEPTDGFTGKPLINKQEIFADMKDHPEKGMIERLYESNVLYAERSFRPDDAILQKELLMILYRLRGYSMYQVQNFESMGQQEIDSMYRSLINERIIKESERNPDAPVTREEAVKFMVRVMGFAAFAELPGLFQCDFKDRDIISSSNFGFIAIAKASGIIQGSNGFFRPQDKMLRLEAAQMVYNYMSK